MLYVTYASVAKTEYQLAKPSKWVYPAIVLVIFLSGASTIDLFDNYGVQSFPFSQQQKYFQDLGTRTESFPYVPAR